MNGINKNLKKEASRIATDTALAALIELVTHTPVDTTAALSNWQVAVNVPVVSEINAFFTGRFGATASASISAAIEKAKQQLQSHKSGDTIIISNLVDYIEQLNNGGSRQEPAGFVERAVAVAGRHVKTAKMKL